MCPICLSVCRFSLPRSVGSDLSRFCWGRTAPEATSGRLCLGWCSFLRSQSRVLSRASSSSSFSYRSLRLLLLCCSRSPFSLFCFFQNVLLRHKKSSQEGLPSAVHSPSLSRSFSGNSLSFFLSFLLSHRGLSITPLGSNSGRGGES